ncbi:zinc finger protein 39-like [Thalassophryne amazonica]|uniref:zinc finger protein 39-like n=1 Tax=Thalassophryne amazonica TaxID=390379 RepID=UPI0014720488|nr:zinc finger protein 39-like [Thalassophryne amazonica]
MSKVRVLRALVEQRLAAAAEEIFGLFERTIAEYQEELWRSKDNERQLLDAVLNPEVRVHTADSHQVFSDAQSVLQFAGLQCMFCSLQIEASSGHLHQKHLRDAVYFFDGSTEKFVVACYCQDTKISHRCHNHCPLCNYRVFSRTVSFRKHLQQVHGIASYKKKDVQQVLVGKEDIPPDQQDVGLTLKPKDSQTPHIKQQEAEVTKFVCVHVKSEDDEEKPPFYHFHQRQHQETREVEPLASSSTVPMKAETDVEDYDRPEMSINPHDDKTPHSSVAKTEQKDHWTEPWEPQLALKTHKNNEVYIYDKKNNPGKKIHKCSKCGKTFRHENALNVHKKIHNVQKSFNCSACDKTFKYSVSLRRHIRSHTGEKPFVCSVCGKAFTQTATLKFHMRSHTGQKPFSCSVCKKHFGRKGDIERHMRTHTGEKPYVCPFCNKAFTRRASLTQHIRVHH